MAPAPQDAPETLRRGARVIRARGGAVLAGSQCPANEGCGADQLAGGSDLTLA